MAHESCLHLGFGLVGTLSKLFVVPMPNNNGNQKE